ncbi:MAG TPA: SDR family oxidoreductase [Humisphaera sp.]|jgi:NAD(P)-dependent dehydrogenase (short-subunit alcohol dehydrogenase family)|nr:SDR family oxidoreductase [Humisphaera sp.]
MDQPVAIITGAGRGIGRATAIELAKLGYRLALLARTESELRATERSARGALIVPTDVTNSRAVQEAVDATMKQFGRIDAVVHCAGVAPVASIAEMSVEEWHAVIDTNLSAAFYLSKAVWPIFAKQQSGVIVNVSSLSARDPFPGFAAYGAAKAGLNLFGLSAAREGAAIGVRVHTIAPGAVETGMFRKIVSAEQFGTDRTLDPADVAKVIAQCVTGDLRYTSGEVIYLQKTL